MSTVAYTVKTRGSTFTVKTSPVVLGGGSSTGLPTGGSTAQALVKNSDTDYDVTWATVSGVGGGSVATDVIWDAAGDLAVGTGANTAARLALGGAGDVFMVSGSTVAWKSNPSYTIASTDSLFTTQSSALAAYAAGLVTTESGLRASADALKAPLASPTFTGTVTLPTGLTGVIRADSGVVSTDSDVTDIVTAASDTAAGKVELATTAETTTGTDTARAVTPAGVKAATDALVAAGTALTDITSAAGNMDSDDTVYGEEDGVPKKFTSAQVVTTASVNAAGAVMESDYDAQTILRATSDNTPTALTMGASTVLARLAAGDIVAATPTEMRTLLDVPTTGEAVLDTLFDANTILAANSDNTPAALTVAEQRIVGRITGGSIDDLTPAQVRSVSGLGIVDSDTGASVASTTAETTILASGPMVRPVPEVGDLYQFDASGVCLNLSGGAATFTILVNLGATPFWTSFTNSIGGANLSSFLISAQIFVKAVSATVGQEILTAKIDWQDDSAQTLKTASTRFANTTISSLNNSVDLNVTMTTQMNVNSAVTSTSLLYATLTRLR